MQRGGRGQTAGAVLGRVCGILRHNCKKESTEESHLNLQGSGDRSPGRPAKGQYSGVQRELKVSSTEWEASSEETKSLSSPFGELPRKQDSSVFPGGRG